MNKIRKKIATILYPFTTARSHSNIQNGIHPKSQSFLISIGNGIFRCMIKVQYFIMSHEAEPNMGTIGAIGIKTLLALVMNNTCIMIKNITQAFNRLL